MCRAWQSAGHASSHASNIVSREAQSKRAEELQAREASPRDRLLQMSPFIGLLDFLRLLTPSAFAECDSKCHFVRSHLALYFLVATSWYHRKPYGKLRKGWGSAGQRQDPQERR